MAHELMGKRVQHSKDTDYFGTVVEECSEDVLLGFLVVEWKVPPNGTTVFRGIHKPQTLIAVKE